MTDALILVAFISGICCGAGAVLLWYNIRAEKRWKQHQKAVDDAADYMLQLSNENTCLKAALIHNLSSGTHSLSLN